MAHIPNPQSSFDVGDELELEVSTVAHGGIFVARHEGRVVFVSDAIDGERVRARITDARHAKFARADTVEVLRASEHRMPHIWPAASLERAPGDRAGGAEFGHIALPHQRALKAQVLAEALQRMAGLDRDAEVEAVPGDDEVNGLGWRTRVRLQVDADGRVGPYAARSHTVVPVEQLPLATEDVAVIAPLDERFPGAASVDLVAPSLGPAYVLINEERAGRGGTRQGRGARGRDVIHERVAGAEFALDAAGFWQVHRGAPRILFDAVQQAIDPDAFDPAAAHLDLYGGVGLLAAAVGTRFGIGTRITSVESDAQATGFAAANLTDLPAASAVTGRVDGYLRRLLARSSAAELAEFAAGTVILDPPRSGAGKDVVALLGELGPTQLVYVACDPVALARDVALFAAHGYQLREMRAFDLFPHTHHVEAVASLAR